MASTPKFGGSNGVPELNLGQPGSARATAGTAQYTVRVLVGTPENPRSENALPQQAVVYTQAMGFAGQTVRWRGWLKVKDVNELSAIRLELNELRTGQTIDANGVRSAVATTKMKATKMVDPLGVAITDKATLKDVQFGETKRLTSGAYSHGMDLTVVFRVLG